MAKRKYGQGTCFLVPLRTGGFVRGVIVRINKKGVAYGSFLGPRLSNAGEAKLPVRRDIERSVLDAQFGDLGLKNGEWVVIGDLPADQLEDLSVPEFARKTSDGSVFISRYDDELNFVRERRGSEDDLRNLPRDALMGYGSVEIALTEAMGRNH